MSDSAAQGAPPPAASPPPPSHAAPCRGRRAWLPVLGLACAAPPLWASWRGGTTAHVLTIGERWSDLTAARLEADALSSLEPAGTKRAALDDAPAKAMKMTAEAWAPIRIEAGLALGASQRINLPPTFNRSLLLCQDWAEGAGGWVGGAVPERESRTGYGLSFIWWTGSQRFATLELPGPGYLRRLYDHRGGPGVPTADFIQGRLGFRRSQLRADDPAPFAFHQAEFQPVPSRLVLQAPKAVLDGLKVGDTVMLEGRRSARPAADVVAVANVANMANVANVAAEAAVADGTHGTSERAAPASPVQGLSARVNELIPAPDTGAPTAGIVLDLDETQRQRLARLLLMREIAIGHQGAPDSVSLALLGPAMGPSGVSRNRARADADNDQATDFSGYLWLPQTAVQRDAGAPTASVWVVVAGHTLPIRVLVAAVADGEVAVREAPVPGLPVAIDLRTWTQLPHAVRATLARSGAAGGNGDATLLRPGIVVRVDATAATPAPHPPLARMEGPR